MKKVGYLSIFFLCNVYGSDEDMQREYYGKIEILEHKVEKIEKDLNEIKEIISEKANIERIENEQADLIKGKNEQQIVEEIKSLIKHEEFNKSINLANAFLKHNEKSIYRGMILYYLGKNYLKQNNYNKAAEYYMDSYSANKNGAKTAKALYKLAFCFEKLNKIEHAKDTLKIIESEYSHTKYAKKANKELKQLSK